LKGQRELASILYTSQWSVEAHDLPKKFSQRRLDRHPLERNVSLIGACEREIPYSEWTGYKRLVGKTT
jgi:hypothetical protein